MKYLTSFVFLLSLVGLRLSAQAPDWQASVNGRLPDISTPVGYSADGSTLYLVRSSRSGVTSVGWFEAKTGRAFLIGPDRPSPAASFEVYAGAGRWIAGDATSIPANAVSAGTGPDGQPLYVLRVSSGGVLMPAAWSAETGAAAAFIGGRRILFSTFEVLVPDWARLSDPDALSQAFRSGAGANNAALVPLRAAHGGGLHPGKFNTGNQQGYIPYGGKEITVGIPESEIFIGSGTWVPSRGTLPPGAIPAGYDDDGSILYMIKAKQAGADALGKYSARRNQAYVPWGGKEVTVTSFEVLCYDLTRNRPDSQVQAPVVAAAGPAQAAVDAAVRRSGLTPVLRVDFDSDPGAQSTDTVRIDPANVPLDAAGGGGYGVFDGRSSVVEVTYPLDVRLDRATVMVRVNSNFSKKWQAIFNNRMWYTTNMHIQFLDRKLQIAINGDDPEGAPLDYVFNPGQWYQIVVVYDAQAKTSVVYVNGAKIAATRYARAVQYVLNQMDIGAWDQEDRFFDGQIDYVYVLNGAMSEKDVMSSFAAESAALTTNTVENPPPASSATDTNPPSAAAGWEPLAMSPGFVLPPVRVPADFAGRLDVLWTPLPASLYAAQPSLKAPFGTGALNPSVVQQALSVHNLFRFAAGVPDVVVDPQWSRIAQAGAVLLAAINHLEHTPAFPAGSGMDKAFYDLGYQGTSSSNIHSGPADTGLIDALRGQMDDSYGNNLASLGHRRWLVEPTTVKVGYGQAGSFTTIKTFGDGARPTNLAAVAWPPAGWVPLDLFVARQAWSISLNPRAFTGGRVTNAPGTAVTITRQRDGRTWTFKEGSSDGSFSIDRSGYGLPFCLIFKPNDMGLVLGGDSYRVEVRGLQDGAGAPIALAYTTAFFSPEAGNLTLPASTHPKNVTVHVDWQNQGAAVIHADSDQPDTYLGTPGKPMTGLRVVVDTPEGVLPVAIQINGQPRLFSPGEWAQSMDGGPIHQFRLVFGGLYGVLEFIGFHDKKWMREYFSPYTLDTGSASLEALAFHVKL